MIRVGLRNAWTRPSASSLFRFSWNTLRHNTQSVEQPASAPSTNDEPVPVGSNSSAKDLKKIIQAGQTALYKDGPYHNLLCLYRALRKKSALSVSPPYHKTRAELYHFALQRRVAQRNLLNQLQVQIDRTNVRSEAQLVSVPGSKAAITFPRLPLDLQMQPALIGLDERGAGQTSFHYLAAIRSCHQRLVRVKELGKDAQLEVGYGVFPPTRKDYLRLFDGFMRQWCLDHRREIHQKQFPLTVLDVGCGSGVLGFLTLKHLYEIFHHASLRAFLLGVDQYHEAVRCSTVNAAELGHEQSAFFVQSRGDFFPLLQDEPNSVRKRPLSRHVKAVKDNQYDFIVCNPPWLPTEVENTHGPQSGQEIVSFSDSYVYDHPQESFLGRFLPQAAAHLRPEGRIFLVHSNLGALLGLYDEDWIPRMCQENQLQVKTIYETDAKVKFSEKDWFHDEKSQSKVLLYEIGHPTSQPATVDSSI